ncbi:hypothetical protein ACHAXS_000433 [Conticribra weissflogii]
MLNTIPLVHPTIEDLLASPLSKFITFAAKNCTYSCSPRRNPNWYEAMNGPFADEYWKASEKNLHFGRICKQFSNCTAKKFRACFCAQKDQQFKVIDFFKVYSPVVQWTTVFLMFILKKLLVLKSEQADFTTAFLHVTLGDNEKV